jgi:hypothetical protein
MRNCLKYFIWNWRIFSTISDKQSPNFLSNIEDGYLLIKPIDSKSVLGSGILEMMKSKKDSKLKKLLSLIKWSI